MEEWARNVPACEVRKNCKTDQKGRYVTCVERGTCAGEEKSHRDSENDLRDEQAEAIRKDLSPIDHGTLNDA